MISQNRIERIKKKVLERFPEMEGVEPRIEAKDVLPSPAIMKKLPGTRFVRRKLHAVTFRKIVRGEDGSRITKIVRTTVDEKGKILKLVHSK